MRESTIWKRVMLAVHRIPGVRLFRNNVGQAWTGRSFVLKAGQTYRARGGERVIQEPRPLNAGLMKGSGDGIGWATRTITPDDVGREVAVFLSVETKTPRGRPSKEQLIWRDNVVAAGGIGLIVRSEDEAVAALRGEL